MKKLSFLLATVWLTGCASPTVSEFSAPDGTTVKQVKCTSDPQKCFASATDSCGGGTYRVVSSESHAGGLIADLMPGPVTWYGMSYICGPSDGKMPDFAFRGQQYVPPPEPITVKVKPQNSGPRTTNCTPTYGGGMNCTTY